MVRGLDTFREYFRGFEFASWVSPQFKLYLIKEFERLKKEEQTLLGWSAKRELAKINYHIHTDAIKTNLIPEELTTKQTSVIYASEADVLNMALFGMTAKQWRENNPDKKGNIRDYDSVTELICLSNMENINAILIEDGLSQKERLIKLNKIAIHQMSILESQTTTVLKYSAITIDDLFFEHIPNLDYNVDEQNVELLVARNKLVALKLTLMTLKFNAGYKVYIFTILCCMFILDYLENVLCYHRYYMN